MESSSYLPQLEKARTQQQSPSAAINKQIKKKKKTDPRFWHNTGPDTPTITDIDLFPNWLGGAETLPTRERRAPYGPELQAMPARGRGPGQLRWREWRQGGGHEPGPWL